MTPNAPGYEQSERALVMRAQEGDASAIAALLVRYRKWIRGRASSMTVSGMDADDLSQEGMIGLVQAIRTFDPSREVQFRTYATTCIHNRMVGAAKLAGRRKNLPLNGYLPLEEASDAVEQTGEDGGNPESLVIRREEAEALQMKIADRLSAFEQNVFSLYLAGYSYEGMAERLGKTVKSIDNALQRIRRKVSALS